MTAMTDSLEELDLSSLSYTSTLSNMMYQCGIRKITLGSYSITSSARLINTGISSDKKTKYLGWCKEGSDTPQSTETYALLSSGNTYTLKTEATGVDYSVSGDTVTLNSGTYEAGDIKSIINRESDTLNPDKNNNG